MNTQKSEDENQNVALSFRPSTKELNELHLTFNQVVKTFNIARQTFKEGEEGKAIINYTEAYHIFGDFKNTRQMGVCMSNIGSVHKQLKQYDNAQAAFDEAVCMLEKEYEDDFVLED